MGVLLCLGNWYDQLRVVFGFYDESAGGSSGGRELLHVVVNLLVQGCSLQIVVLNLCCIDLLSEAVILRQQITSKIYKADILVVLFEVDFPPVILHDQRFLRLLLLPHLFD